MDLASLEPPLLSNISSFVDAKVKWEIETLNYSKIMIFILQVKYKYVFRPTLSRVLILLLIDSPLMCEVRSYAEG